MEDEQLGTWVYCMSHLRPHSTGWCSVHIDRKKPLAATTKDEAYAEVRANGWPIYGDSSNKTWTLDGRLVKRATTGGR